MRDLHDYGKIDVSTVLKKSSNVGTSRIALKTGGEWVHGQFARVGFGQATGIEFPGEAGGTLPNYTKWKPVNLATMSYGYGLRCDSIADGAGLQRDCCRWSENILLLCCREGMPVILLKPLCPHRLSDRLPICWSRLFIRAGRASVLQTVDYRVAGKTGTAHELGKSGYEEDKYLAVFAGFAPLTKPRLAIVVVISVPQKGEYYGGEVAALVFSRVMENALRVLNVVPDQRELQTVSSGGRSGGRNG